MFITVVMISRHYCIAQIDTVSQRIFLVGDAGDFNKNNKHPVIDWLKNNVDWDDAINTVIYLGDNIYPLGLPMENDRDKPYIKAKRIIDYQIGLVKTKKAKAFFVPGNHDWMNGKMGGWQQVQNEVNYINGLDEENIKAWPLNGCPGPVEVELNEQVVLVFVDSHWFLHVHDKPGAESNCEAKTVDEFITELQEIADRHHDQLLVLAMHHPLYTHGSHGGNYTLKQHIFPFTDKAPNCYLPLPVLGSIYVLTRGVFGSLQDVNHPLYRNMAKQIEVVLRSHPNAIHVAGHDHNLQYLLKNGVTYIVSGSGSQSTRVSDGEYSGFHDSNKGFAMLEVRQSGKAEIRFYDTTSINLSDTANTDLSKKKRGPYPLKRIVPATSVSRTDEVYSLQDSIMIAANLKIKTAGKKVLLHGKNYRAEWNEPITVPIFDIGKEQGGLRPIRRSGSSQNKALRLADANGKEWTLHSIEKSPQSIIPPDLVSPFSKDTVSDALSASYPFAALSIAPLQKAAGIPAIRRKLVYVPNDPRLERFRKDFSSTMAILEEMEPVGVKTTYNTDELILRLAKDNDDHVDQAAVLKARLLDNFIMDFERQENVWRWATKDTGKEKIYYPISRHHNQAFFVNEGLIPRILRKPRYVPEIEGFRAKAYNIKTFNRTARNFDHFFLNELSATQWEKQIDTFLKAMTEEVITQSLQLQPKEIKMFSTEKIVTTLKQKRDFFKKDMMTYYAFLSRKVDVVGTNERESFFINKTSDGSVEVTVNKIDSMGNISSKIYDRIFDPKVTNELRLYGLNHNDSFNVRGGHSPITIRIIGGAGEDEFINEGKRGKVLVYDAPLKENNFKGKKGLTNKLSNDPQVNHYNRLSFKYDYSKLGLSFGFNTEDYLLIGGKFETIKQGFRKDPYGMRQYILLTHALTSSSYQLKYEGDFTKVLGNNDLVLRANAKALGNTNFFGFGNNTVFDGQRTDLKYFRAKYDLGDAAILVRKRLQSWLQVYYGASFQYLKVYEEANKGKFVSNTLLNGLDANSLYDNKMFAGALLRLNINSKNNLALPTRGFTMEASVRPLFGLNKHTNNIAHFNLDMATFISLFNYPRFVLGTRIGYGRIVGNFEFPQAQYLSGNDNLRGYRRQRFAGHSILFNNTELRFRFKDFKLYLLPGAFGMIAFHDIGRVWMDRENSNKWHNGYGGGIWISPIKRFVLTGSLTFSKEESGLPVVKFGFQF